MRARLAALIATLGIIAGAVALPAHPAHAANSYTQVRKCVVWPGTSWNPYPGQYVWWVYIRSDWNQTITSPPTRTGHHDIRNYLGGVEYGIAGPSADAAVAAGMVVQFPPGTAEPYTLVDWRPTISDPTYDGYYFHQTSLGANTSACNYSPTGWW